MINKTVSEYKEVIEECKTLFKKKTQDYGTAWRILRVPSLTDQIFIKAQLIRSIQEKGEQKVDEHVSDEFVAIVNYCIMAIMQLQLEPNSKLEMSIDELLPLYEKISDDTLALLINKNHDYGEVWRDMRVSSMTDIILMKLLRVKQIEDNQGKTLVLEGIDANYRDMVNYAIFCLIKLREE